MPSPDRPSRRKSAALGSRYRTWSCIPLLLSSSSLVLAQTEDELLEPESSTISEDAVLTPGTPQDEDTEQLPTMIVRGRVDDLVGFARSSSTGRVSGRELLERPRLRPGEVLEAVPGLIATQHSGSGKANQFFLRGFNLDHGTDFSADLDGMPLNLPTHGHGQGYLDINAIIPEMLAGLEFRKGPYHARQGDFSSAGSVSLRTKDHFDDSFVRLVAGEDDYLRAVGGASPNEHLTFAVESEYWNGPWEQPERSRTSKLFLKLLEGDEESGRKLSFLGFRSQWDSTDQVPRRAVESGLITRFGNLDPSLGGETLRLSLLGEMWNIDDSETRLRTSLSFYDFNLWSNFTYFLDDPVQGDQFEQEDRRLTFTTELTEDWTQSLGDIPVDQGVGVQLRYDYIPRLGLYRTARRARLSTVRSDRVHQASLGAFYDHEVLWTDWLRSTAGVRGDLYYFDVNANDRRNTGDKFDTIVSPKAGVVFGPFYDTELALNGGFAFHSNDARGVTTRIDPVSGDALDPVDPLVRTEGFEVGLRTSPLPDFQSTVTWFVLKSDSELVFVGDAGTTEAAGESRRQGVELANAWRALPWLSLEADYSYSRARFTDPGPEGRFIPGALEQVASVGARVDLENGLFGALRWRHFGDYPLIEDDTVRAGSSDVVNLLMGVRKDGFEATIEILNLLDSDDSDIEYFFNSRLPGEGADGVGDVHFHPVIPRSVRASFTWRF